MKANKATSSVKNSVSTSDSVFNADVECHYDETQHYFKMEKRRPKFRKFDTQIDGTSSIEVDKNKANIIK